MRTDTRWSVAFLILVAAGACVDQSPVRAAAKEIVVQAVLDAAANDQYVIVQTTNGSPSFQTPVAGAIVTLTLPGGRQLIAAEEKDSLVVTAAYYAPKVTTVYHFALDRSGVAIVPGATYALRVVVPDGRIITGMTTVPNAPPVSASAASDTLTGARDSVRLSWPRVAGAGGYQVVVHSPYVGGEESTQVLFAYAGLFDVFVDTTVTLTKTTNTSGTYAFLAGQTHQVVVSAVDSNYYDYYRLSSDPFTAVGVINHLSGGLGVFGSIVEIRMRTVVVR